MNQRQLLTSMLLLVLITSVMALFTTILQISKLNVLFVFITVVSFIGLFVAHLKKWHWSAHALVILTTIFTIIGNPAEITLRQVSMTVLVPSVLAAMLIPSWKWNLGAFALCLIGIAAQAQAQGPLFAPDTFTIALILAVGIAFAGSFAHRNQRAAEESALHAEKERARAESKAEELEEAISLLQLESDQQRRLLDLVVTLEVPALTLAEGMLFAPIVGHLDPRRAELLTKKLLHEASEQHARMVVLDIAGVPTVDTTVAQAIMKTVQALHLLGCEVTLSGITASVALALTRLGAKLDMVHAVRTPQEALADYLQMSQNEQDEQNIAYN